VVSAPAQLVAGRDPAGAAVRGTGGLAPAALTAEFGFDTTVVEPADLGDLVDRIPPPASEPARILRSFFVRSAAAVPFIRGRAEQWRPDVILRDTTGYDAWAVGELLDIPVAVFDFAPGIAAQRAEVGAGEFAWYRTHLDLPPDPDLATLERWLAIVGAPPGWVEDNLLAPTAHLVQPPEPDALPGESAAELLQGLRGRPLLYVSFGTVFNTPELFATVFDAVESLDVDVIATIGHNNDPDRIAVPANVRVTAFVSQSLLLPHCDLVVTHGGYGSLMGALRAATPAVCLPLFPPDNRYNAGRLVALGAGVSVPDGDRSPESIRAAITTVLENDTHRTAARAVAASMAALPPIEHTAELLEQLGKERRPLMRQPPVSDVP
jgi:UDP:flavonoid glycosyltransferase YjiC (YdhE family)